MIPNTTQYSAAFIYPKNRAEFEREIVAWNDTGEPMVAGMFHLVTAEQWAEEHGAEFTCLFHPSLRATDEEKEVMH